MAGLVPCCRTKMPILKRKPVCPPADLYWNVCINLNGHNGFKKCSPNQHL